MIVSLKTIIQFKLPNISKKDFNGHQSILLINHDDNQNFLAILVRKRIFIDQIQYKQQKLLSLKSKKILLKYLRKKHDRKIDISVHHLSPVTYWEESNYSYLISIINEANIKFNSHPERKSEQSLNKIKSIAIPSTTNKVTINEN